MLDNKSLSPLYWLNIKSTVGHWAPSLFLVVHWTTRSPRRVNTGVSPRQGTLPWASLISLCLVQWTTMGHENLCQLHVSGCLVSMHCAYVFLPVKVRLKYLVLIILAARLFIPYYPASSTAATCLNSSVDHQCYTHVSCHLYLSPHHCESPPPHLLGHQAFPPARARASVLPPARAQHAS